MKQIAMPTTVGNEKPRPTCKFLSAEEERVLIARWQKHRDLEARNQLIEAFRPLLFSLASDFIREKRVRNPDLVELAHVGAFGLEVDKDADDGPTKARGFVHAIGKFDLGQPYRLATYARAWILDALSQWYHVECCSGANVPRGEEFLSHVSATEPRLNADGDTYTVFDLNAETDFDGQCRYEAHERAINAESKSVLLQHALDDLTPVERRVAEARHLAVGKRVTLPELGKEFGVSGERVRQIESVAIRKLSCAVLLGGRKQSTADGAKFVAACLSRSWTTYHRPSRQPCPTNMLLQLGVPSLKRLPKRTSKTSQSEISGRRAYERSGEISTYEDVAKEGQRGSDAVFSGGYSESNYTIKAPTDESARFTRAETAGVAKEDLDPWERPAQKTQVVLFDRCKGQWLPREKWYLYVALRPIEQWAKLKKVKREKSRRKAGWKRDAEIIHVRHKKSPYGGSVFFKANDLSYYAWPPGQPGHPKEGPIERPKRFWGEWRPRTSAKIIPFSQHRVVDRFSIVEVGRAA
jgi:RNA polymerase sigma factor (sigma-70 family)